MEVRIVLIKRISEVLVGIKFVACRKYAIFDEIAVTVYVVASEDSMILQYLTVTVATALPRRSKAIPLLYPGTKNE